MKKILPVITTVLLSIITISCATLQQDVYITREYNSQVFDSIHEYEKDFIQYDSQNLLGNNVITPQFADFEKTLLNQLKNQHLEPVVRARLNAYLGLLSLIKKDTKSAAAYYSNGKKAEAGDEYVILLEIRLEKNPEKQIQITDTYLSKDNNPLFLLQKAILYYYAGEFNSSIGIIDNAFLLFDNNDKPEYRSNYSQFRNLIWELYSTNISDISQAEQIIKNNIITCDDLVSLTLENSHLLDEFTMKSKTDYKTLTKQLYNAGMFNAVQDLDDKYGSAEEMLNSTSITKIQSARFIWNLYVLKKGKKNLLNRYSSRYLKMEGAQSPINDININNIDFDAVMGVIENEIMTLPDGHNFEPAKPVSSIELINYIQSADK